MNDVIIIGAGPAGLSAAIYTVRAGLQTTVIYTHEGALSYAKKIENYFGFEDVINGKDLLKTGMAQAKRLGVNIVKQEVVDISKNDFFEVTTTDEILSGKSIILATGKPRKKASIKGLDLFEGKGVSYCAVCDGFFHRGKICAVLGDSDYAAHEAMELKQIGVDVRVFTDGKEPSGKLAQTGLEIIKDKVLEVAGNTRAEKIICKNYELSVSGIFVAMGAASTKSIAAKLGIIQKNNSIDVNKSMMTNIEGLFAAGDCTGGILQISKAVSDGTHAAYSAIEYVRNLSQNKE